MKTQPKPHDAPVSKPEIVAGVLMPPSKRGAHLKEYQWKPGASGNPGGKPAGTYRVKLGTKFLQSLEEDFEKNGAKVISKARNKDPVGYLKIIAGTLPKQMEKVAPLEEMSDAELHAAIALLKSHQSVQVIPGPTFKETGTGDDQESDA